MKNRSANARAQELQESFSGHPVPGVSLGSLYKKHFSRFFAASPERLHFAAHSHHPWPDVSRNAHLAAWDEAARLADGKWSHIFESVVPHTQAHIARLLELSDPGSIALAPNTHEFLVRIASCFERSPVRILTTDGEFHSFSRQRRRWQEEGLVECVEVLTEPFETFHDRFLSAAQERAYELVFVSRVFFDSGFAWPGASGLAEALGSTEPWIVLDGYHEFMARPAALGDLESRCFYLAGGYKYAMAGEGVCFLHCPPGYGPRPVNTGWYAGFGTLAEGVGLGQVPFSSNGQRFAGSTVDPSAYYRFNAVMDLWQTEGLSVAAVHGHARFLQQRFLMQLAEVGAEELHLGQLVPGPGVSARGNFLTFRTDQAGNLFRALEAENVMTDYRGDRLRFGFGVYQDESDVDELVARLRRALSQME